MGDVWAVAQGLEDPEHASGRHRGEEVGEVQTQEHGLAAVAARVVDDRAPAREALGRLVDRDVVEDLTQDPALDLLEAELGGLDDARQPAAAGHRGVAVVAQPLGGDGPLQSAHVGQPRQLPVGELERRPPVSDTDGDTGDRPVTAQRGADAGRAPLGGGGHGLGPGVMLGEEGLDEAGQVAGPPAGARR